MPNRPPKPAPPADPLADLRQDGDPVVVVPVQVNEEPVPETTEVRPMVSQALWDQMVSEMVAAWHMDPTSLGFLHGGGSTCGCWYMARHALRAAVPVMTEEDMEEHDLESASV